MKGKEIIHEDTDRSAITQASVSCQYLFISHPSLELFVGLSFNGGWSQQHLNGRLLWAEALNNNPE